MIGIIRSSKSIGGNRIASGKDAVASGGSLSPYPASSDVVVVEVAPKIILSSRSLWPVPSLLNSQVRAVHVVHVPSVSELGEFSSRAECVLTHVVASCVAGDFKTTDRVSECDNTSSPALVEWLIRVVVGGEVGVVVIEGTSEHPRVDDASHREPDGAGSISELWIAAVAGHPSHKAVLLLRPNGCLECESLLNHKALPVIGVVLRNRIRRCRATEGYR